MKTTLEDMISIYMGWINNRKEGIKRIKHKQLQKVWKYEIKEYKKEIKKIKELIKNEKT